MNQEELQVAAFEIILHSGNARSEIHEAFAKMREGSFDDAESKLNQSNEIILEAHHAQTKLLQEYASGVEIKIEIEIIMVHAQDHLMTTMTLLEVAKEMLALYKKVN
ncbi:TPA: PTS cellobiose transporter subunit IIA [Streptococcus pneumoniae]|uniref:PTS cellobiose transporter subunit IIA n=1 Tax=Streptococcus pneumoniae TaxID=1313 RepID=UPI0010F1A3CC|nr:PTS cellobiose transporter subunit IIA [Streptococcus pneumoniae]MBW8123895.1 PTS cellobiose transporter subunit IIA [Streptococcus pneumoniae]VNT07915.1 lichenan-specific phosphotransferase EIIA component [Streptococcus pneumoniae]VQV53491.1 lichenan-specific phosphotransferase EIIA component [Streptococcus pneumoniae]VRP87760.1 lichenan-specific phosphotransferase EIIA component [Streptococcus pneumoniae]HEU7046911.1 PTS cellobiose transporter subunit IIA [Streptococcus pneumoniae]